MSPDIENRKSEPTPAKKQSPFLSTLVRVSKYVSIRLVTLFLTVTVGIFLTILIANMGGYVDEIIRGEIQENVQQRFLSNPELRDMDPEVRRQQMDAMIQNLEHQAGLDKPFIVRSANFLTNALTLQLGRANRMASDSGSNQVRLIILERLPSTLVLLGTADIVLFFSSVFIALGLSRRYGSFVDKAIVGLSPISSAPGWFYGLFMILIFAGLFKILPFGGMVDAPPPESRIGYVLSLLKHMVLPVASWVGGAIFLAIYNWRTFFLIYSSEDYVEMAKAKGLSSRKIERRYILRPTLPTIITNFALLMIGSWTGAPILETVFQWPGLGRITFQAIGLYDTAVIVGTTVVFAYLLTITIFLLNIIYALVDPRVKIGGAGRSA